MQRLKAILFFQKKIFVPGIVVAAVIGLFSLSAMQSYSFVAAGTGYFLMAPVFHYFSYDVMNRNEYYFYNNFGLSKAALWISTMVVALVVLLVFRSI